jgi:hypothetical protein
VWVNYHCVQTWHLWLWCAGVPQGIASLFCLIAAKDSKATKVEPVGPAAIPGWQNSLA